MNRKPLPTIEEVCKKAKKIPMSHGVDFMNVAAARAVVFWQNYQIAVPFVRTDKSS